MNHRAAVPSESELPLRRTRVALLLVSAAAIGLQLSLMRALSLQLWSHLAYMVIGVALLGFGASGTALTLLRRRVVANKRAWFAALLLLLAGSVLLVPRAAGWIPLNVQFLAWDRSQAAGLLALELMLLVPFLLAGGAIGVALLDRSDRLGGHYAANLIGSGAGAFGAVLAMHVLTTGALFTALAIVALVAAAVVLPLRRRFVGGLAAVAALIGAVAYGWPWRPAMSEYKALPGYLDMPGTEILHQVEGPLGRIDVVAGPAVRHAPGLGLGFAGEVPPHVVVLNDGDAASAVYQVQNLADWRFMDATTRAAPYHMVSGRPEAPSALIIGAGGGADIGLALHHGADAVVALEMNRQLVDLLTGPLRARGGEAVYLDPAVTVLPLDARGYLIRSVRTFDVIQLPPVDAFGASGAGLHAVQESYLYTVEAFGEMLDHLSRGGVLCITRWARTPPRDELRALATTAAALRRRGYEPAEHLALIRNWATATILASALPLAAAQIEALRAFCADRGFDLCYLPGLARDEANRYHVLDTPLYYDAAQALLGPGRDAFTAGYLFDIAPATDDRPYFFRSLPWTALFALREEFGAHGRAFLELGALMSAAALAQGILVGLVLIVLPLVPLGGGLRGARRRLPTLAYFLLLGAGFMLLEICFLQKLILYLAHPLYAAAAAIAAFLVCGGLGSLSTAGLPLGRRAIVATSLVVVALAAVAVVGLDRWLALSRGAPLGARLAIAGLTIAPLAFAMGRLFPAGLAAVGRAQPALVPWAWAVNGFASVAATVACPLLAAEFGFRAVLLLAVACYLLAGVSAWRLTDAE
jgi:hypothetical protein